MPILWVKHWGSERLCNLPKWHSEKSSSTNRRCLSQSSMCRTEGRGREQQEKRETRNLSVFLEGWSSHSGFPFHPEEREYGRKETEAVKEVRGTFIQWMELDWVNSFSYCFTSGLKGSHRSCSSLSVGEFVTTAVRMHGNNLIYDRRHVLKQLF